MLLNQFNSLFELFAAFNLAYTLSDGFNSALNERVISGFKNVSAEIDRIKKNMQIGMDSLHNMQHFKVGAYDSKKEFDAAKLKFNSFESEFIQVETESKATIVDAALTNSFKYICFFSSLYCIFMLFIVGFHTNGEESNNDGILHQTIWYINFLSFVFVLFCLWREQFGYFSKKPGKKIEIGYRFSFVCFLIIFIGALFLYLLLKWVDCSWHREWMHMPTVLTSVTLPVAHFLYYSYRAYRNSNVISARIISRLREFELRYEKFYKDDIEALDITIKTVTTKFKITNLPKPRTNRGR